MPFRFLSLWTYNKNTSLFPTPFPKSMLSIPLYGFNLIGSPNKRVTKTVKYMLWTKDSYWRCIIVIFWELTFVISNNILSEEQKACSQYRWTSTTRACSVIEESEGSLLDEQGPCLTVNLNTKQTQSRPIFWNVTTFDWKVNQNGQYFIVNLLSIYIII